MKLYAVKHKTQPFAVYASVNPEQAKKYIENQQKRYRKDQYILVEVKTTNYKKL